MGGVLYRNNWGSLKRNDWCTFTEISNIVDNSIWPVVTTQMFYGSGLVSENSIISISSEYSLQNVTCKDIQSGKLLWEFKSDKYPQYYKPYTIELTRDDKYVVLSNLSRYIHILDFSTGEMIAEIDIFIELESKYYDLCLLTNNSILISASNKLVKYDIEVGKFETIIEFPDNTFCQRLFGGYDRIRGNCNQLNEEERLDRSFVIKIDAIGKKYEEIGDLTYGIALDEQHYRYSDSQEALIYSDRSYVSDNQGVFVDDFDVSKSYSLDKSVDLNCYEFLTDSTALVTTNKGLEVYNFVTAKYERVIKFPKIIIKNTFDSLDYNGNQFLKKQRDGRFLLTNQDGCLYVFDLIQTSIEEPIVFNSSDKLYPNPVSNNTITIEHDTEIPELDLISICDVSGKDVANFTFNHTGSETEIYLGEIPKGVYFISYAANGSLYSHKFVVK
jgi:outer membrane protein assembly factor BamB